MTRILVIEDEESFSDQLLYLLTQQGFVVEVAADGEAGLGLVDTWDPDLVLLDLMLPGMSGLEVCQAIRRSSRVPIIIVTARGSEVDKVVGLEMGADDYVTKPFSERELVARIRAVLRGRAAAVPAHSGQLSAGPVVVDVDAHTVTVDGREVVLPLKEFQLLEVFVRNPGRVLTRDQLLHRVWGDAYVGDGKTLDVHIRRLRSRIEQDPGHPRYLVTVRGLGYRLDV